MPWSTGSINAIDVIKETILFQAIQFYRFGVIKPCRSFLFLPARAINQTDLERLILIEIIIDVVQALQVLSYKVCPTGCPKKASHFSIRITQEIQEIFSLEIQFSLRNPKVYVSQILRRYLMKEDRV